ncbi:hypothetical protein PCYB_062940, partial [Plasmodium cynomolgi strain B]
MKKIIHISFFFLSLLILTREYKLTSGKITSHARGNLTIGSVDSNWVSDEKGIKEYKESNDDVEEEGESFREGGLGTHVGSNETEEGPLDEGGDTDVVENQQHEESVNSADVPTSGGDGEVDDEEVDGEEVDNEEVDGEEVDDEEVDGEEVGNEEVDGEEVDGDLVDTDVVDTDMVDDDEEVEHEQIDYEQVDDDAGDDPNWDETHESAPTEAESAGRSRPYHHRKNETNDEEQGNIDMDAVKMETHKRSGGDSGRQNNAMPVDANHLEGANEEGEEEKYPDGGSSTGGVDRESGESTPLEGKEVGNIDEQDDEEEDGGETKEPEEGGEEERSVPTSDAKAHDLLIGDYKNENDIKKEAGALVERMIKMLDESGRDNE